MPASVRELLPAWTPSWPGWRAASQHPGEDGSARLLVALADGQTVESVLLPRDGLCVSTQVGCAVGCVFCMTGRDGLLRQSAAPRSSPRWRWRAAAAGQEGGVHGHGRAGPQPGQRARGHRAAGHVGNIGHKNLVFSTVGDARVFERLPQGRVKPALALSLHTTRAELRELLPRAPRLSPEELVEQGERYARATGYPIQYQWTLIEGINDGEDELDGIVRLLQGRTACST
jgi:23S rRNA (adenine2503-C2)-methyltransferase